MKKNIVIEGYSLIKNCKWQGQLATAVRIQKIRKAAIAALRTEATAIAEEPFCGPCYYHDWESLWDNRKEVVMYHCGTGLIPERSIVTADTWCISMLRNIEKNVSIIFWDAYGRCPENTRTFCLFLKGDKFVGVGKLQNRMSVELMDTVTHGSYDAVVADMKIALKAIREQPGRFVDPRIAKHVFGDNIGKEVVK